MNINRPPGYYGSIATVWLRLVAVLFLFYCLISVVYTLIWQPEREGSGAAVLLYGAGAILLWLVSRPLGRFVARGLDDPSSGGSAV